MTNEKNKKEIAKLIEEQEIITTKIKECLLNNVRLDELYLYGGELANIALQIQYLCQKIAKKIIDEVTEENTEINKYPFADPQ